MICKIASPHIVVSAQANDSSSYGLGVSKLKLVICDTDVCQFIYNVRQSLSYAASVFNSTLATRHNERIDRKAETQNCDNDGKSENYVPCLHIVLPRSPL